MKNTHTVTLNEINNAYVVGKQDGYSEGFEDGMKAQKARSLPVIALLIVSLVAALWMTLR